MDQNENFLLGQIKGQLDTIHDHNKENFKNLFARVGNIESNTKVLKAKSGNHEDRIKKVENTLGKAVVAAAAIVGGGLGLDKLLEIFLP